MLDKQIAYGLLACACFQIFLLTASDKKDGEKKKTILVRKNGQPVSPRHDLPPLTTPSSSTGSLISSSIDPNAFMRLEEKLNSLTVTFDKQAAIFDKQVAMLSALSSRLGEIEKKVSELPSQVSSISRDVYSMQQQQKVLIAAEARDNQCSERIIAFSDGRHRLVKTHGKECQRNHGENCTLR